MLIALTRRLRSSLLQRPYTTVLTVRAMSAPAKSSAAANVATSATPATTAPLRFVSAQYANPTFHPLAQPLSFDDVQSWPHDPMRVFSQWYAEAEGAYNRLSPSRMDAPVHWPNTMQVATVSSSGFPAVRTVLLKGYDPRGLIFFTNYMGDKGRALAADPRVSVNFYWKTLERQIRVEGLAERLPEAESDAYFHERPIQSQIGGTVSPQSSIISSHAELEQKYVQTVQAVAQHVKQHLEKPQQGAAGGIEHEAELEATKLKISRLLGAMTLEKAGGAAPSAAASDGAVSSESALAHTHSAHQLALSFLQELDSNPLTQPSLHALVPRPSHWGGFLIRPLKFEFWCDGQFRLHSRIVYKDTSNSSEKMTLERAKQAQADGGDAAKTTAEKQWSKAFLAP
jgi:pyridoxamine-phosphate oxidase